MVLTQLVVKLFLLSFEFRFPYHYGSYATDRFRDAAYIYQCFHTTMVLTQLELVDEEELLGGMFPYHYGSHATCASIAVSYTTIMFPYHYGSHATRSFYLTKKTGLKFPYHYGSHAT